MKTTKRFSQCLLAVAVGATMLAPTRALAIVNWARKYNVDCATCHDPAVPRLNALGHQFRKMGYRFDEELGKAGKEKAYKEIGDWVSVRFRTGYAAERFSDAQKAGAGFNAYQTRNGFRAPDVTLFYAGAMTKNLSLFTEVEFADVADTQMQVFMQWMQGTPQTYWTMRLGQMHTLSRIGWGGFDRPTGISTPDALGSGSLTTSPVPFKVGEDQRGVDFSYAFNADSRVIAGIYNGVNQGGSGITGNGAGFGDSDGTKDFLLAYEQQIGESGYTLFGYYGFWDQAAGTVVSAVPLPDNNKFTQFQFMRVGATASYVFDIFDKKKVGNSELQAGYMYAKDFYPANYPSGDRSRDGHALWAGLEQRLPHNSAVFYRFDYVKRSNEATGGARHRHSLGAVYTVAQYLRLSAEGFQYDQASDTFGVLIQAMINY